MHTLLNEAAKHIITAWPLFAKELYIKRHDKYCAQLHFNLCTEIGVGLENEHWKNHVTDEVETSHIVKVTILWNQEVRTDRTILYNKPDIIIRENKKGTAS
jgi:hypothetical protein